jgi:predicted nuclease with TOPRIM domain
MAEVFGILAGVAGVLKFGSTISTRLRNMIATWRHAPTEILALHNEVEDLRLVLDEMQNCKQEIAEATQRDAAVTAALQRQIQKAQQHFETLDVLLNKLTGSQKFKKKFKWLNEKANIERIKGQIRLTREETKDLLIAHNVYGTRLLEFQ